MIKWTSEKPKAEGWYWWLVDGQTSVKPFAPTIVYVKEKIKRGKLVLRVFTRPEATPLCGGVLDEMHVEHDLWAGPLYVPWVGIGI